MNQFNHEIKASLKKIDQENLSDIELQLILKQCFEKIGEFHLYSLGLKYYSYCERNADYEDDFLLDELLSEEEDEASAYGHVHDENCQHDHEHNHNHNHNHEHEHNHELNHENEIECCDHEEHIESPLLQQISATFEDYIKNFSKTGEVVSVNELLVIKEELKKLVAVLTAYGDQITFLENVYFKTRYTDEKMMALDTDETFSQRVVETLMLEENSAEIREHLKFIYPELPMRMTKNKFFGFVDQYFDRLKGINVEDVKNHVQLLKETFDPRVVEGYGEYVEQIAVELKRVEDVLRDGNTADKDSAYHFLYHLTEDKNELLEDALDIAELLNHLVGISLCELEKDNQGFGIFNQLVERPSDEEQLASLFEAIEVSYEPLGEHLLKVSQVIEHLQSKESLIRQLDKAFMLNELIYAFELSKEGYFIERPHKKSEIVPNLKELALIKAELIELMESTFASEERLFRRSRMSLMMSVFQIVHTSGQEIYDYIYQAISSCDVKGEKIMSMQNIYSYINDLTD